MTGRTSKVLSDQVLASLPRYGAKVTSTEVAKLAHHSVAVCGRVLKELYEAGLVSRVHELRRREVFGGSRKLKCLCYTLTPQGLRIIEEEHVSRISHESGPEKGQPPRVVSRCNSNGDDRTHGVEGGRQHEPPGKEPEPATDGAG